MKLHEIANQTFDLSIAGWFNGHQFTLKGWTARLIHDFAPSRIPESGFIIYEIAMPDKRWLLKISRLADGEFDYYIPDTIEQENKLWESFWASKFGIKEGGV